MKIRKRPVTDTDELGSADILSDEDVIDDALDAEPEAREERLWDRFDDGSESGRHDTPSHIRAMAENAPSCDEGDATHLLKVADGGRMKTTLVLIAISMAVLVGFLAFRAGALSSAEYTTEATASVLSASTAQDGIVTDVKHATLPPIATASPSRPAPVKTATLRKTADMDSAQCASPKTDRAWLECASSAYAKLRAEQKRLVARIEAIEAQSSAQEASTGIPMWLKALLGLLLGVIVVVTYDTFFRRKVRGDAGEPNSP